MFLDEPEMVKYLTWDHVETELTQMCYERLATMCFWNAYSEILWSLLYGLASYMISLQV